MSNSLFDLTGRAALVTGGNKGLGKAMARVFAQHGANVVIASRTESELRATAADLAAETGRKSVPIVADMTNRADVARLARDAVAALGKIDILVNNAGSNKPQTIDQISDEVWDEFIELNLTSCMALSRAVAPGMKERRWGRIIHISSIFGLVSHAGRSVYSATKSALQGLARASALDLGPFGITVNCIAPGPFLTELTLGNFDSKQREAFAARTALGRWGEPGELAGPALLLVSDAGSYITGAVLVVDGGTVIKSV